MPSRADVTAVRGSAFGYFAKVALFGGPPNTRPCANGSTTSDCRPRPAVTLPARGSATPITDSVQSGNATVGPATLFTSGPITVSTQGTTGATGSVTTTADIQNVNTSKDEVFTAARVSSTCTGRESGTSGSTTIASGRLQTSEGDPDVDGDETFVDVPANPAPNTTFNGTIETVGDKFRYVFNEQIRNPDGSLTINAGHQYLLGPTAVGDVIFGQVVCGVSATAAPPDQSTVDPGSPAPPASPPPAGSPAPGQPGTGSSSRTPRAATTRPATATVPVPTPPPGSPEATAPGAGVTVLSGGAYGHYSSVSLFGGAPGPKGPAPQVTLPAAGAEPPVAATEPSAQAVYGPAKLFGGIWPPDVADAPPSGPITVTTTGRPGPGGFVTSTAAIVQHPAPVPVRCEGQPAGTTNCTAPGGFGPSPPTEGRELHATCTATETEATGSARFVGAVLATSTTPEGDPKDVEPVPDNPPPNYTRTGQLTNVGDNFRVVYNEQIKESDRSITVNAVHLYLLGPIAVGEQIVGQVRCSTDTAAAAAPTTSAPATSTTRASGTAAGRPDADDASSVGPFAAGAGALLAGAAGLTLWARRRGLGAGRALPPEPPS